MIRLAALVLLAAGPAAAHGTLPGAEGFQAGIAHPFLAGAHLLLLAGLGALFGLHRRRYPLAALLAGLGVGLLAQQAQMLPMPGFPAPAILVLALLLGGGLAAGIRFGAVALTGIALASGLLVGADTDGATGIAAIAGVAAGMLLIVLNAMAAAQVAAARLNGVPLRVAGSWIAAAAILVLALHLRPALGAA